MSLLIQELLCSWNEEQNNEKGEISRCRDKKVGKILRKVQRQKWKAMIEKRLKE